MKTAAFFAALFVVSLSCCRAAPDQATEEHDPAIGFSLSLISGVMTRTTNKWTFALINEGEAQTKVLASFQWNDEGYREQPEYTTNISQVVSVRLKKIRLADSCLLDLEVTAKNKGDCLLSVSVGGHHGAVKFIVR